MQIMQSDPENTTMDDTAAYHPLFSSPESDTVLGTKDGVLFRVHSFTLKTTSGWFRAMFSLPQRTSVGTPEVLYVDEDAATLEGLLRMVCGLPIPQLHSYEIIEPLLYAAEKYDMSGPLSIARALLMTGPFLSDPLRLYALACRYGWDSEAKRASTQTLALNLHAPEHRLTLRKLGTEALLSLFELHHSRRESLRKCLNEYPFVKDTGVSTCSNCHATVNYQTWRELKYVIVLEMDRRPLGDTILNVGLNDWPAARACWNAKCLACERVLYDKKETLKGIKDVIDQLPTTVDANTTLDSSASPPINTDV